MTQTDSHLSGDDFSSPRQRIIMDEGDQNTEALSLFAGSPSQFSRKYSDDRYRSLVQESPPAGFNIKTPIVDDSRNYRITPKRKEQESSSARTEDFKTARDWDELLRPRKASNERGHENEIIEQQSTPPVAPAITEPRAAQTEPPPQQQKPARVSRPAGQPLPPKPHTQKSQATLPSYMRSTASYESRMHQQRLSKERRQQVPDFRSSTRINAMDDIRNEMKDEDTYIPLAVRVKLFEQGLGSNGRSAPKSRAPEAARKESAQSSQLSSSSTSRLTRPRSPKLLTSYRSASHRRSTEVDKGGPRTSTASASSAAATVSSTRSSTAQHRYSTRSNASSSKTPPLSSRNHLTRSSTEHRGTIPTRPHVAPDAGAKESATKRRKTQHSRLEVKPFRFATDERAAHHQKAFREKLDMWKKKEEEADRRGILGRGIKRKAREE